MSVVIGYRRQHVRGSMAWKAGDLPGNTGVTRDNLSRLTMPTPDTTYPEYTTNVEGGKLGLVTTFPGKNLAWSDQARSAMIDLPSDQIVRST